jgi:hypothetical protein
MSSAEGREVYVVMRGDIVEGVCADRLRAQDTCAGIIQNQVEAALAHAAHWKFQPFYLHGVTPIVWPYIRVTRGMLDVRKKFWPLFEVAG